MRSNNPLINDKYIGHSAEFHKRQIAHRSNCNNVKSDEYNYKVYVFIRENGGFDNWHFEILETANLEDEKEAASLERDWIETLKPTLNIKLPARTPEELAEYNRVRMRIRYKKNREDPEYRKKDTEKTKKWAVDNPEKAKALVAANAAKHKEKITCVCGAIHNWGGKARHLKSDKHKEFIENNPQET